MGGTIRVDSEYGRGSTFTLELPQAPASPQDVPEAAPEAGFLYTAPNAVILVVDDSKEHLQMTKLLLGRIKSRIDTAGSGEDALEKVRTRAYDLIFLDYMMPGMDGLETFKAFAKIKGFATPVIALSGEAQKETREALLDAGFADYLQKPVAPQELEDAIRKRLPPELVEARGAGGGGEAVPSELEAALDARGVSLKEALEYNNESLDLLRRTAEILVQSYDERKGEMEGFIARGDWEGLRFMAHSLKSTLRGIGAANAADTAKRLETYCKKAVGTSGLDKLDHRETSPTEPITHLTPKTYNLTPEYALIKNTAALLFTEWEEAINGYRTHN
jgi:CheY-like chemotaxis protein/HPt (histidine-containing phosphotransfer) domain-containing protein